MNEPTSVTYYTLSYVEESVDPKRRKIHSGPNILFQKLTSPGFIVWTCTY